MPCRDGRDDCPGEQREYICDELMRQASTDNTNLKKKIDKLTEMLCASIRWMEDHDCDGDSVHEFLASDNEIKAWWKEHGKFDKARVASEKLSREESKALFEYILKNRRLP